VTTLFHSIAVKLSTKKIQLINISYDISRLETKKREIKALQEGMRYFKLNEAILITQDEEESLKIDGQTIKIKPLWKWLLET